MAFPIAGYRKRTASCRGVSRKLLAVAVGLGTFARARGIFPASLLPSFAKFTARVAQFLFRFACAPFDILRGAVGLASGLARRFVPTVTRVAIAGRDGEE